MSSLASNYPHAGIAQQLTILSKSFPFYRPLAGDGSCFYRAIGYSLFINP